MFAATAMPTKIPFPSPAAGLLDSIWNWATGKTPANPEGYHLLVDGMRDARWVGITIGVEALLALAYLAIALHWSVTARGLQRSPARSAAVAMRSIFFLSGVSALLLVVVRLYLPVWRIYDLLILVTALLAWRYAYSTSTLRTLEIEITRAAELEREVEQTRAEVQQKAAFFNAISHDLRTPLNRIVLQSHIIDACARTGDTQTLASAVEEIRSSASRSEHILSSLLAYAQIEATAPTPAEFSLRQAIEAAAAAYEPLARRKGLAFDIACDARPTLHTDALKLEQCLSELIENAVKFTEIGSVRIEAAVADGQARIDVVDTGSGIRPDLQASLFRELSQLHNKARDDSVGLGLGLVIARRIAEQLGGSVQLASTPGRGSRFTLRIPTRITAGTPGGR